MGRFARATPALVTDGSAAPLQSQGEHQRRHRARSGGHDAGRTAGGGQDGDKSERLTDLLARMRDDTDGQQPSLGEILDALGTRAYGPLLLAPALIALGPTGMIHGMSLLTGTLILALSIQMLVGRDRIWMPERLLSVAIPRDRLEALIDPLLPYTERIDRLVHPRQSWLATFPFTRLIAIVCAVLALAMLPLAFVPFGAAAPSAALVLFSLGLVIRDGYIIVAGFVAAALATGLVVYLI